MNREDVLRELAPWREKHVRLTWKPVVSESDDHTSASKFSGTPWLQRDEAWPLCVGCRKPLQLFLQLNLDDLPAELGNRFGTGLLQMFYCANYDRAPHLEPWRPFAPPTIVRVVQPTERELENVTTPVDHFPPRTIIGWDVDSDLPSAEECDEQGLVFEYDFKAKTVNISCADAGTKLTSLDYDIANWVSEPKPGDKLSGWPNWVQRVEYPTCPQCGQRMDFVVQLDSEDHLPFMFGDVGCGHITQCPTHKDIVAFGWACG